MSKKYLTLLVGFSLLLASEAIEAFQASTVRDLIDLQCACFVSLHEPIVFTYRVVNDLDVPVAFDFGYDRIGAFEFARVEAGRVTQTARPTAEEGGSQSPRFTLAPGESEGRIIVLDRWMRFSTPGTFDLSVRFDGSSAGLDGKAFELKRSWTFPVRIRPRNEKALEAKCDYLWTLLVSPYARVRQDGMLQFREIRDPVAIPYMEEFSATGKSGELFLPLVAIGTPEARAALERLSASPIELVSRNAKTALARFKK